jgi:hypothetical protein
MRRITGPLLGLSAVVLGLLIAWVDTWPTWDDTGITVAALFLACAGFGAIRPAHAWRWALLVGIWIPLLNIALHQNYGSLLALVFAGLGAYAGAFARRLWARSVGSAA